MVTLNGIGVVGAGGEGRALAAYLASRGLPVHLCTRDTRVAGILKARGRLKGEFRLSLVTDDPAELLAACRVVFIATVTTAYPEVAAKLAPHLTPDHVVVLFSSKLCGSVEFSCLLRQAGVSGIDVVETDALFAARPDGDDSVDVLGMKGWNLISGATPGAVDRHADMLTEWFPMLERARNPIERGLTDFGAVAHVPIALANLGTIDRAEDLLFYAEGLSERTVVLLEHVEREFGAVAAAYGAKLLPMTEVLDRYYGCTTTSLLDAIRSVEPYKAIQAPQSLDHRFLREDIASTLVPLQALAARAGVATPMVDAAITIKSAIGRADYAASGRTLARLDWEALSHKEILSRI
ncbi:NAD/NADP octopine/nopaline dehydrogenase family protein [Amycolatopsis sp. NPDC059657]|uniref:NAD/NADP-dependent octopine/nopaline dehydrogenase family protein n=1 Tax=Amycolatopsis sp. NPDC059657 TaxID=3346899 RepID=UPI00366E9C48